jgi:FAD/FMN-containing dehydrogenase
LGVDQIVAAKLVNPNGEIVAADDDLLKGIRGAGGMFGVIVELTIKVFPLKEVSGAWGKPWNDHLLALCTSIGELI